uniref:Chloride channel, nucleotide-sensitive, 1A n=1 Tax=Oncorhynchus mykiss TaxID=8022 RepID=A0A8K9XL10_ONCMY
MWIGGGGGCCFLKSTIISFLLTLSENVAFLCFPGGCRGLTGQGWASLWSTPLSAFTPSHETSAPTHRNIYTSWSMQNSTVRNTPVHQCQYQTRSKKILKCVSVFSPDEMQENAHDEEDEEDECEGITEIRFVPSDKAALESMFSAMCECQALHPDPDDEDSNGDFDGDEYDVEEAGVEHGQGDIPSFCTYEEGVSGLRAEGQATLQRLEGMLAQSVANTFHMAGVRTDETNGEFDDGVEVDAGSTVAGQFEDADIDH